jgi:hypothetical protein
MRVGRLRIIRPYVKWGLPQFLESAVSAAEQIIIDILSMREVTCWRW